MNVVARLSSAPERRPTDGWAARAGAAVVLSLLSAWLFHLQASTPLWGDFRSDLRQHLRIARQLWEGSIYIPHPGFHFTTLLIAHASGWTLESSSILVLTAAIAASYWITLKIFQHYLRPYCGETLLALLAFVLSMVSAIYAPFFNPNIYLGQGSPNVWHSPTWIAAEPFALLGFYLSERWLDVEKRHLIAGPGLTLALVLAIGTIYKPSFAVVAIPAFGLVIGSRVYRRKESCALLFQYGAIITPTLVILLMQYVARYGQPATFGGRAIVWAPFQVWSQKTHSILFSAILALAFPLSVLITHPRQISALPGYRIAWIFTIVAFLQRALLAESGEWMMDGNWAWGYFFALKIIFIYSTVALITATPRADDRRLIGFWMPILILILHLVSGFIYFWHLVTGAGYR